MKGEAREALNRDILVPIEIESGIKPPFDFRSIQTLSLINWDGSDNFPGFQKLITDVISILGEPPVEGEKRKREEAEREAKKERRRKEKEEPKHKSEEEERKRKEAEEKRKSEEERRRKEAETKIKPDKPEPAEVKPPEPKPDATATIEPEPPKPRKSSNVLKYGVLAGVIVLVMVGIWLYISESQKAEPILSQKVITNGIGMEFVLISAGSFTMGSKLNPEEVVKKYGGQAEWYKDEHPQHKVTINKAFYLQTTEVTQGQWKKVMGDVDNLSKFKECGDDCPVESVSWEDARKFIKKLNEMEGSDTYRLPTEAEWEYAVRAGSTTAYSFGDDQSRLTDYAWFSSNSNSKTHRVGTKKPNSWGLYDMHGNVWEWVEDDWHENYNGAPDDGRAWIEDPRGRLPRVSRRQLVRRRSQLPVGAAATYGPTTATSTSAFVSPGPLLLALDPLHPWQGL